MRAKILEALAITAILLLMPASFLCAKPIAGQSPVGQYEVKVYSQKDYVGEAKSYVLNIRTHRIGLVNRFPANLDNAVSSIHVGSQVYAILFDFHDFHVSLGGGGSGNLFTGLVKVLVNIHKKMTPLGYLPKKGSAQATPPPDNTLQGHINVGIYTASTPQVRHNDVYTSMLIIPKGLDYAYGVALYNPGDRFIRIEPIPDEKKFQERRIPDFGNYLNNKIGQVAFLGPRIKNTRITLYDKTHYKGESITLPGEGSDVISFKLAEYNFADKTESIRLSVKPVKTSTQRAAAPPADSGEAQEVLRVQPIPTMKVMLEGRILEQTRPSATTAQAEKRPTEESTPPPRPADSRWEKEKTRATEPHDPDLPHGDPQKAQDWHRPPDPQGHRDNAPGAHHEATEWDSAPDHPPHEELPPGITDLRGRWRDNHGSFFEILQHGPGFVILGDGVPVHGAGIQLEPRRIGLIVQSAEGEVMHLEGRVETMGPNNMATRIGLNNGIVLERD